MFVIIKTNKIYFLGKNGDLGFFSEKCDGKLMHFCMLCAYSSNYVANIKRHLLIHTPEQPYRCAACDYRCKRKEHLKRHMMTHLVK